MELSRGKRPRQDSVSDSTSAPPPKLLLPPKNYAHITAEGNSRQHNGDVIQNTTLNIQPVRAGIFEDDRKLQQIMQSLHFPEINARRDAIPQAAARTLAWLFGPEEDGESDSGVLGDGEAHGATVSSPPAARPEPSWREQEARARRASVRQELQRSLKEHGLFWVCGKAASGKSTLMKYLQSSIRVRETLIASRTTQSAQIVMAGHYFWNPGSSMQKSIEGMYRTLLYHIFHTRPELAEIACGPRWQRSLGSSWSLDELFEALARIDRANVSLCLFIDGLDECSDDLHWLLGHLKKILTLENARICVSSRPWPILEDELCTHPGLRLENVNEQDIADYAEDQMRHYAGIGSLHAHFTPELSNEGLDFVRNIVAKAQGSFLWTFLVLRRLGPQMRYADSLSDLSHDLLTFPSELEDYLRDHIFARINPRWRESPKTAGVLRFCLAAVHDLEEYAPLLRGQAFSDAQFGITQRLEFHDAEWFQSRKSRLTSFVNECGADLVSVSTTDKVRFTHRSVPEFLETDHMCKYLNERTPPHFRTHCRLRSMAELSAVKFARVNPTSENPSFVWKLVRLFRTSSTRLLGNDIARACEQLILEYDRVLPFDSEEWSSSSLKCLCNCFMVYRLQECFGFLRDTGRMSDPLRQSILGGALCLAFFDPGLIATDGPGFLEFFKAGLSLALCMGSDLNRGYDGSGTRHQSVWQHFLTSWTLPMNDPDFSPPHGLESQMQLSFGYLGFIHECRHYEYFLPMVKVLLEHGAEVDGSFCVNHIQCDDVSTAWGSCEVVRTVDLMRAIVPQAQRVELDELLSVALAKNV